MQTQRALSGFLVTVVLSLLACVTVCAAAQEDDSGPAQAKERRFAVVHAHFGNNCAGYLYVSKESVRYEALVPENYKNHSFQIQRAAITALQPWILMGQPQNVVEIKTGRATYHFWLLRKGVNLNAARSSNLNAIAAPAEKLIAAIRNPERVLKQTARASEAEADAGNKPEAKEEAGADADASGAAPPKTSRKRGEAAAAADSSGDADAAPEAEAERQLPTGALEGVYVGFSLDGTHMGTRHYYFTADGWVINNIPFVNMDNFNMAAYRADPSNKLFIGRYRVDGNLIHIVWSNNADRREIIKHDEAAAEPGIDTYIPTCRCTGKRFSGRYHWGSPTDQLWVQFFPDGTFLDHGLTDQIVGFPNPHGDYAITDRPRTFRGTYSIRNQKLTFHFADGIHATVAFLAPKALEKAPSFEAFGAGHGTGVKGAETVIVLMLYEEHYRVQP